MARQCQLGSADGMLQWLQLFSGCRLPGNHTSHAHEAPGLRNWHSESSGSPFRLVPAHARVSGLSSLVSSSKAFQTKVTNATASDANAAV